MPSHHQKSSNKVISLLICPLGCIDLKYVGSPVRRITNSDTSRCLPIIITVYMHPHNEFSGFIIIYDFRTFYNHGWMDVGMRIKCIRTNTMPSNFQLYKSFEE